MIGQSAKALSGLHAGHRRRVHSMRERFRANVRSSRRNALVVQVWLHEV